MGCRLIDRIGRPALLNQADKPVVRSVLGIFESFCPVRILGNHTGMRAVRYRRSGGHGSWSSVVLEGGRCAKY